MEVEKPLYSSFVGTDLDARLRARGIDKLVIAGFTTDCCVDCTVRDAFHRNYDVFIVADACASYEVDCTEARWTASRTIARPSSIRPPY